jgi:hypothetical protein
VWNAKGQAEEFLHPSVVGFMKVMAAGSDLTSARAQCQLVPSDKWEPVRAQLVRNGLLVQKSGTYVSTMAGVLWARER